MELLIGGSYSGSISGTGGLTVTGASSGSFSFFSSCSYSGATRVVGGGSVALNLWSNAKLVGTSSISVSGNLNLLPFGLASPAVDMLNNGELALRGATLNIGSNSQQAYDEHTGTLSLRGGVNSVAFYPIGTGPFTSQPLSLTAATLERQDRAVLRLYSSGAQFGGGLS